MALIDGDEMRKRLQELLKVTDRTSEDDQSGKKKIEEVDGELSYTGSFGRSN